MKSYLEIKVPIRKDADWFKALRRKFADIPVKWQNSCYHITMAFLQDATGDLIEKAEKIMDNRLKDIAPISMTFDKVDAFKASSGNEHIIHITSTAPNEFFMKLTKAIREDLAAAGLQLSSGFILHVTLGRVPAQKITIDEVKRRLSSLHITAFTLSLKSLRYLAYKDYTAIEEWNIGH